MFTDVPCIYMYMYMYICTVFMSWDSIDVDWLVAFGQSPPLVCEDQQRILTVTKTEYIVCETRTSRLDCQCFPINFEWGLDPGLSCFLYTLHCKYMSHSGSNASQQRH